MKDSDIILGCVYRWSGGWANNTIVRVLRYGGAGYWTVQGPRPNDVPYNHAYAARRMKRYRAVGRVGGEGTFWQGYEYPLGEFPFYWLAYVRAWIEVEMRPYRAARIERV